MLLAYGFCIENNLQDSVALKIKMPEEKIKAIEEYGIKLPTIDDYTNSVVANDAPLQKQSIKMAFCSLLIMKIYQAT